MTDKVNQAIYIYDSEKDKVKTIQLKTFLCRVNNILRNEIFNYDILYFSFLFLLILSIFEIAFTGAVRHTFPFIIKLFYHFSVIV